MGAGGFDSFFRVSGFTSIDIGIEIRIRAEVARRGEGRRGEEKNSSIEG